MKGLFGGVFDMNHDGEISPLERAAEYAAYQDMVEQCEDQEDESESIIEDAGLDEIELEFMDEDERKEALEDAGLDPDDFDWD